MRVFSHMPAPSTFTIAKWAAYLLPVVKIIVLGKLDLADGILKDLVVMVGDLAGEAAKDKIEAFLKTRPDAVRDLLDQHLSRHTGAVLGRMVHRYAQEKTMEKYRALLIEAAEQVPDAWITYLAADGERMPTLRGAAFTQLALGALLPGAPAQTHDTAAIIAFFRWAAVEQNMLGPLMPGLTPAMAEWITQHLSRQLLIDLCQETEEGNAAWKEALLRLGVEAHGKLDRIEHNQAVTAAAVARIENSPGFDLDAYASALLRFVSPLPLAEIVNQPDIPTVRVSDVFVPLQVREVADLDARRFSHSKEIADWDGREAQHDAPDELRGKKEQMAEFLRSSPPRDALNLRVQLILGSHIVLGEAGGGKTLLSRHIAALWAAQRLDPALPDTVGGIPIYIELKDYARALDSDRKLTLLQYCHHGCDRLRALDQHVLRQHLGKWRAFFLLDGLDEVLDPDLKDKIIREIISLHDGLVRFIITSRLVDFDSAPWRESPGWQAWRIDPLDATQQSAFIQRYHDAFFTDEKQRAERIARLHTKLRDFHRLAELAGTPLLLTLLCLVNREPALPETRTALYEAAARLLLHHWDFVHFGDDGPLQNARLAPLALEDKHLIMRRLAWLLMLGRPDDGPKIPAIAADSVHVSANLFPETLVAEAVRSVLTELNTSNVASYVERVPTLLSQRNSVLCPAGEGKQSFIHRTFLEFYAAWAWHEEDAPWLGDEKPAEMTPEQRFSALFSPHWQQPAWRVILILHLGRAKTALAEKLLRQLLALGQTQRDRAATLSNAGGKMAATLLQQEALLLAAECFSETQHRGKLHPLDADLRQQLETLARLDFTISGTTSAQDETNGEHRRRAVRLHTQLWGGTPEGQAWLLSLLPRSELPPETPCEAIIQLGQLLGPCADLRAALLSIVAEPKQDANVRLQAIETLGQVWGREDWLRAALLPLLADTEQDVHVRRQAVETLGQVWGREDWLQDALLPLMADTEQDADVRCQAIATLGQLWGREDWLRAALLPLLADTEQNEWVCRQAIATLGQLWGREDWLRDALLPLVADTEQNEWVRRQAIDTLGQVWGREGWLQDALLPLMADTEQDADVRCRAIATLGQLWGREDWLRDAILPLVADPKQHANVRRQAIEILGQVWGREDWLRDAILPLVADQKTAEWLKHTARHYLVQLWPEHEAKWWELG